MSLRRRMHSIPIPQIRMTDPFWARWQRVLIETTLPHEYQQLVETGRIANFERAAGQAEGRFVGLWFNDSDVYKWVEACAYALAIDPSATTVRSQMDGVVEVIAAAQEADGYLNTFFQLEHPDLKWRNLNTMHEMYCGGHLIEAGVALFECLGERKLLDVGIRFADHVMSIFGPEGRRGYCGHQEIELALVRLAKVTQESKYADFALWLIEERGKSPSPFVAELEDAEAIALSPHAPAMLMKDGVYQGEYCQDHAPIREHSEVVGHAVRAMYYYIAAAELSEGKQDAALEMAIERTWKNLTGRRMYVTGGIGPSASNEGFTRDFDLPNLSAYAETCAAIGLVFWGQQMLELTGNAEYADVVERALYNGVMSGINLGGDRFFYANPLESRGTHERVPWFNCACCPPNIARLIGSVSRHIVSQSEDAIYIHLPAGFETSVTLAGTSTEIEVKSDYPNSGRIEVKVNPARAAQFTVAVRLPTWCDNVDTDLPGANEEAVYEDGYMIFSRRWSPGDVLTIDFEMEPKWIEADPRVRDNLGRSALMYGPLVYCCEEVDAGFAPQLFMADTEIPIEATKESMLEGIVSIEAQGACELELFPDDLYAEVGASDVREASAKFIPYYAWNNRGPGNMQVWVRRL